MPHEPEEHNVNNVTSQNSSDATAWHSRADELTAWTFSRLVNRTDVWGIYGSDGKIYTAPTIKDRGKKSLTIPIVRQHCAATKRSHVIGTHSGSIGPESTALWIAADLDVHHANDDPVANWKKALHWFARAIEFGFTPLLIDSNGKGGFHIRILFAAPIPLWLAHWFARWLFCNEDGTETAHEVFPKQNSLTESGDGSCGNWLRLPGKHHKETHWSKVWNGEAWSSSAAAVGYMLAMNGDDPARVFQLYAEAMNKALTQSRTPSARRPIITTDATTPYGRKALEEECDIVRTTGAGGRNNQLNSSAFSIGTLVGAAQIERSEAESALADAANMAGLSATEAKATIRSGMEAGIREPRDVPEDSFAGNISPIEVNRILELWDAKRRSSQQRVAPTNTTKPQSAPPDAGISALDLMRCDMPEPAAIVQGFLMEGLTILAGRPKGGKSWAALNIALAVGGGGKALATLQAIEGDVLYLALEDNRRRLRKRLSKMLGPDEDVQAPARLDLRTAWFRLDKGGLAHIREWLIAHPGAKLVVIDTLAKIRQSRKTNGNVYDEDYEAMAGLQTLALEFHVAFLIVHHTRKAEAEDVFDTVSGSLAITGAADTIWVLKRQRGENRAVLHMTGRDIDNRELILSWNPEYGLWSVDGDAVELPPLLSGISKQIFELMERTTAAITPTEVASLLELDTRSVKTAMWRMFNNDVLRREQRGLYSILRKEESDSNL